MYNVLHVVSWAAIDIGITISMVGHYERVVAMGIAESYTVVPLPCMSSVYLVMELACS